MSNYQGGLVEAKRAFLNDVRKDKDFIEYKKGSDEYGTIIAGTFRYVLDKNLKNVIIKEYESIISILIEHV